MYSHLFCYFIIPFLVVGCQVVVTISDDFVYENVITIDVNASNSSCCKDKKCTFDSLNSALECANTTKTNVLVNIKLQSLVLESDAFFSGCSHIKITGLNHIYVHCKNNSIISFIESHDIIINNISWNNCGKSNGIISTFQLCSNIKLSNCSFVNSFSAGVSFADVVGDIFVHNSSFLSNAGNGKAGGMSVSSYKFLQDHRYLNVSIIDSTFYNNTVSSLCAYQGCSAGLYVYIDQDSTLKEAYINIEGTLFNAHNGSGSGAVFIQVNNTETVTINAINITYINNFGMLTGVVYVNTKVVNELNLLMDSNTFTSNGGNIVHGVIGSNANIKIANTGFYNSVIANSFEDGALFLELEGSDLTTLDVFGCVFQGNKISFFVVYACNDIQLSFSENLFADNSGQDGIKIMSSIYCNTDTTLSHKNVLMGYPLTSTGSITCAFTKNNFNSNSVAHYGLIYISKANKVVISNCTFDGNYAILSMVYTYMSHVYLDNCNFTANKASGLYMVKGNATLQGQLKFHKNSASYGGGMVIKSGSFVELEKGVALEFIGNFALKHGGAIYVELPTSSCIGINVNDTFEPLVTFHNNSAGITGSSTYFLIPKVCSDLTAMVDALKILQCQDGNSSDDSEFSCKEHMSSSAMHLSLNNSTNISVMLGEEVNIPLKLTDYFGHIAEPTVFSVECVNNCISPGRFKLEGRSSKVTVISDSFQGVSISGTSPVSLTSSNVTIKLSTIHVSDLKSIELSFTLQLSACHSGFVYNRTLEVCQCFTKYSIIYCNATWGKIMRGYWFGFVKNDSERKVPTLSNCPLNYCQFKKCNGKNEMCQLESSLSKQCHHHREGRACGDCAAHYSLPYDATECVSSTKCRPIYTVLVVILTIIYWLVIVVVTFVLMSLNFKVSYLFSLIYFYSIVDMLLGNNLYISDGVFQVVTLLSSFAKLSPQFLGKLCFVEGLSGIDQQFIHYIHPLAVLFLLITITMIARNSLRVSSLISSSVIRVICVLLLLSYTSIASTSLQLLRSLDFTDIDGVYTYYSPEIKYFHGRHGLYGSVAVVCEVAVGIGLPLILILDPFLSSRISLSRIRPLLDHFEGGYKDKYRCYAAFYFICRQIIFLIVQFTTVSNHDKMNFVLLVVCAAIAMLHAWVQPYVKEKLNSLDEVILISAVVIVGINGSTFSSEVLSKLIIGFVFFPLLNFVWFILLSLSTLKRLQGWCAHIRVFLWHGSVVNESMNDAGLLNNYDQCDRIIECTESDDECQPLIRTTLLRNPASNS